METTVLLLHPNYYFRQGLEQLILQWFHTQGKRVRILPHVDSILKANIIFSTATQHPLAWWHRVRRIRNRPLLFLLVEHKHIQCCGYEDGQLAITDAPETLSALLDAFIATPNAPQPSPPARLYGIVQCLSPREREVLWGYKRGMDNQQISQKSGMSIKAISAYRNHAMQKLLLKNHADLHYWLHSVAAENLANYFKKRENFITKERC